MQGAARLVLATLGKRATVTRCFAASHVVSAVSNAFTGFSLPSVAPAFPGSISITPTSSISITALPFALRGVSASAATLAAEEGSDEDDPTRRAPPAAPSSKTLQEALGKLVDVAVELVEQGKIEEAVSVLKQGIDVLEVSYPGSPEVGELYNQVALLKVLQAQLPDAAVAAERALEVTRQNFGERSMLTGHRMLRLGSIRFAQGQLREAAALLEPAQDLLRDESGRYDPGIAEASAYLSMLKLGGVTEPEQVTSVEEELMEKLKALMEGTGRESMLVSLLLDSHGRLLNEAIERNFRVAEAFFKQHIALQELRDPNSEPLALAAYKMATMYYAEDMLHDARGSLQKAIEVLRATHPEEHDLVALCKHRVGVISAAMGDSRTAQALLAESKERYSRQESSEPLAQEAEFGLQISRLRTVDFRSPTAAAEKGEALAAARKAMEAMAAAIGPRHLLSMGAAKCYARAEMFANR